MKDFCPLKLINALRETDLYIHDIFMMGSCYRFHLFLKELYPDSKPFMHADRDHVVSKIGDKLYDITGEIQAEFEFLYEPLNDEDLELVESWSFDKKMMLQVGECPSCEEPIIV
jgi:hypothetical protein